MKIRFIEILEIIKFKIINMNFFLTENSVKIVKNNGYNNVTVELSPHLIKAQNKNDISLLCESVRYFLKTLKRDCDNFDSSLFEENFKLLLFDIRYIMESKPQIFNGYVEWKKGFAEKLVLKNIHPIFHELLHVASKVLPNSNAERFYSEGYTQLLEERYFNYNENNNYFIETLIMSNIEAILDKNYMEKEYFKGNLKDTIKELTKYTSVENVELLLKNMGYLFECTLLSSYFNNFDSIQNSINDIFNIMFECLKNKLDTVDNQEDKKRILNSFLTTNVEITDNNTKQIRILEIGSYSEYLSLKKRTLYGINEK